MKYTIRQGVFETNSSSTHSLAVYSKSDWNDFNSGKLIMLGNLGNLVSIEEMRERFEKDHKGASEDDFRDWLIDEYTFDNDSLNSEYEILEQNVPNSDFVAVSLWGYD